MKLPVDTSSIAFLCALEPQPVLAFDTKQPRADENGEPLYVVQLIALGEGEAEILAVKVPGLPSGLRQGHPVADEGASAGCAGDDALVGEQAEGEADGVAGHLVAVA